MHRRCFLQALAAVPLGAQQRRYDLLIRNGEVRDPADHTRRRADVGISDGKIAAITEKIPPDSSNEVVDAEGMIVAPGLIDLHTHCFFGGTGLGVEADPIAARSGVTTWVDAGSFGYDQTAGFRRFIVQPAQVRIFGYVYLYPYMRNPDVDPVKY